jgi:ATP-dependent RNA helicase RhlE
MTSPTFKTLELHERTLAAVEAAGYTVPTEVQHRTIPEILAGKDVLATAQTGTGKTAAFVLPMLQRLQPADRSSRKATPSALILTPTRELAAQIVESVRVYGKGSRLRSVAIYGGASRNRQIQELKQHPDIVVATPGRLLDLISDRYIDLKEVSYLVLDEADRMLDMGFIPVVRSIIAMMSSKRQTALFSATMPPAIQSLANDLLTDPVRIQAESGELKIDRIDQSVMYVDQADKIELLPKLIRDRQMFRVLVFTRTKHRARKVEKILAKQDLPSDSIHGDKSQAARTRALANFKSGKIQVLVATDVASRGIDVDDITHVVNFELPNEAETYVHRIGRTARAGAEGNAISLCDASEMSYLRDIERLMSITLRVDREHPFHQERTETRRRAPRPAHSRNSQPRRQPTHSDAGRRPEPQGRSDRNRQPARAAAPTRRSDTDQRSEPGRRSESDWHASGGSGRSSTRGPERGPGRGSSNRSHGPNRGKRRG